MNIWHGEVGKLHWDACHECEYGREEHDEEDFPLWNDGEYACRAPRELTFVLGWGDTCVCDQFREAK